MRRRHCVNTFCACTSRKVGGVDRILRLTLDGAVIWSTCLVALKTWLACSVCGNVEWSLRP